MPPAPSGQAQTRLETEKILWLANVRPEGRPHLTPVWFAWDGQRLYACIQSTSVKAKNIAQNKQVVMALEDGVSPVICEGEAEFLSPPWPQMVIDIFQQKYDWDITEATSYNTLLAVTPAKWLIW